MNVYICMGARVGAFISGTAIQAGRSRGRGVHWDFPLT